MRISIWRRSHFTIPLRSGIGVAATNAPKTNEFQDCSNDKFNGTRSFVTHSTQDLREKRIKKKTKIRERKKRGDVVLVVSCRYENEIEIAQMRGIHRLRLIITFYRYFWACSKIAQPHGHATAKRISQRVCACIRPPSHVLSIV